MFQMKIYVVVVVFVLFCFVLLLLLLLSSSSYSGAVSGGLDEVLKLAEFIADIYQQFPHGWVSIINCEAQQQGED
jgi:preprotein translocase subunit SecG